MRCGLALLAALLLLAGCETPTRPAPSAAVSEPGAQPAPAMAAAAPPAHSCSGGPTSLTIAADRGIGGTGAPSLSDRGIGGTGVTGEPGGVPSQAAERGGGGTGIVGVVTGFRSLCVDGIEVAVDRVPRITEDGTARGSATLRIGEVAAVEARGPADDLRAVSIAVRHEVSGPITAASPSGDRLEVAGQRVLLTPQTQVAAELRTGTWVAVSGLRDLTNTIRASRIDARSPGEVIVQGVPEQGAHGWQIGGLPLKLPPGQAPDGERFVVAGDLAGGVLRVSGISRDPFLPDREQVQRMLVESYPLIEGGQLTVADGISADLGPNFGTAPPPGQPVVLELVNSPANMLLVLSWHRAAPVGSGHGKPDTTAPPQPMQTPAMPSTTPPVANVTTPPVATVATPPTANVATSVATPAVTTTVNAVPAPTSTSTVTTPNSTSTTTATTSVASSTASSTASSGDTSASSTSGAPASGGSPNTGAAPSSTATSDGGASGSGSGSASAAAAPPAATPVSASPGGKPAASAPAPSTVAGGLGGSAPGAGKASGTGSGGGLHAGTTPVAPGAGGGATGSGTGGAGGSGGSTGGKTGTGGQHAGPPGRGGPPAHAPSPGQVGRHG